MDGASLTVCEVDNAGGTFTLMLISYSQSRLTLPSKAAAAAAAPTAAAGGVAGDAATATTAPSPATAPPPRVNLEADVTGKLVERFAAGLVEAVARLEAANARLEARVGALEAGARGAQEL